MTIRANLDALRIRQVLGRADWRPPKPWGDDSWLIDRVDGTGRILVSLAWYEDRDGVKHDWIHASMSYRDRLPEYADLKALHRAVFGTGWAYQCFAPPSEHVNRHEFCLHLWGRADGTPVLPDFSFMGEV